MSSSCIEQIHWAPMKLITVIKYDRPVQDNVCNVVTILRHTGFCKPLTSETHDILRTANLLGLKWVKGKNTRNSSCIRSKKQIIRLRL